MCYETYSLRKYEDSFCDYEDESCKGCRTYQKLEEKTEETLMEVVKMLYSKDDLDVYKLESLIDHLCHEYAIPVNHGDLQIQRKDQFVSTFSEFAKRAVI